MLKNFRGLIFDIFSSVVLELTMGVSADTLNCESNFESSGIIENDEDPLTRAKIEIFEEVGIKENEIKLLKIGNEIDIISPQYKNHQWHVFPFLFETEIMEIKLNWENSDFKWIEIMELEKFNTVPNLDQVLFSML